jgi:hypothetical protein
MSYLKEKNVNKCFSLLREFIDEAEGLNSKKGVAILALNHLQKITAGDGGGSSTNSGPQCDGHPRADG